MKQLNYQTLQDLNYDGYLLNEAPERVLQFGEGNFMRAFVDFFIDKMNETANFNSKVVLVQPIPKFTTPDVGDFINEQEGLYTLYLRGSENGQEVSSKRVISCISRCLNAYSDYEAVMECAKKSRTAFHHLQYNRSRNRIRSVLPVYRYACKQLSCQTDTIFVQTI